MAVTRLTDIIEPSVFLPYLIEQTVLNSLFFDSGIVVASPELQAQMAKGGDLINMPFWHDLDSSDSTGADAVTNDDPDSDITPYKVNADEQVAVKLYRAVSFAAADLAGAVAGDDPMRVVAARIAPYWARRFQSVLLNSLSGILAAKDKANANVSADSLLDISAADTIGAANKISSDAIISAKALMGDAADQVKVIAMHSAIYTQLQKQNVITYVEPSDAKVRIPYYQEMRVLVTDALPSGLNGAAKTHTIYLFAPGCFAYAETPANKPVAVDRDELAGGGEGIEYFVSRRHICLHPIGFKFLSQSVAGASPTNAELATGTNWKRVWERKNVPLVALRVNA